MHETRKYERFSQESGGNLSLLRSEIQPEVAMFQSYQLRRQTKAINMQPPIIVRRVRE